MSMKKISEAILGVGVDDTTIDLFESQYPVPTGVSYNSYVIRDEKIAILDTVDDRATDEWLANVTEALAGEKPAYLVVHHMEPDHSANMARLAALYPEMQVVGNAKTFLYMDQFFGADAVADIVAHNAAAVAFRVLLHRGGDVVQPVSRTGILDPFKEALPRDADELQRFRRRLPDRESAGR